MKITFPRLKGRQNEKKQRGRVRRVRPFCSVGEDASVREPEQRVETSQRDTCLQSTYDCHEHLINSVFDCSSLLTKVQQGGFTSSKEMTSV